MRKPNILYLHSHDTGRYIQPYGHAIPTPHLRNLAETGVLFRQNFCVNPTCSPSRASLLTGSYPHENGMLGLAHRGFSLNNYSQHIIHRLRGEGYLSALAGVQHIAMDQSHRKAWEVIGYDEFLGEPLKAHERAAAFLSNLPDRPFFLSVGFLETHREFPDLENAIDDPKYSLPPAPLPDTPATRQDVVRFKASARILDQKMGFVLDALERNGLADNTLVVCTTDHGIAFPRMKCNLHDSGTGVMLVMRGPGGFSGGKAIDAMTNHLDLFPTICDLLQIEPPDRLRGKSLLPLVRGEIDEIHEELFAEVTYHAAYEPMRSVRTKRWKYIKRFERRTKPVLPNCDDGESKSFWLENGWSEMNPPDEMLFDLVFDPSETNNLAAQPTCPGILENMRARLYRWMRETNDPLLHGPVCPPPTARVNDPDGLSPGEKTISSQPEAAADADKLHR